MHSTYRIKETYPYQGRVAEHVAPEDVADTIRPWFPDAPWDVMDAIDDLHDFLTAGTFVDEQALFLGLSVERDD